MSGYKYKKMQEKFLVGKFFLFFILFFIFSGLVIVIEFFGFVFVGLQIVAQTQKE